MPLCSCLFDLPSYCIMGIQQLWEPLHSVIWPNLANSWDLIQLCEWKVTMVLDLVKDLVWGWPLYSITNLYICIGNSFCGSLTFMWPSKFILHLNLIFQNVKLELKLYCIFFSGFWSKKNQVRPSRYNAVHIWVLVFWGRLFVLHKNL